MNRLKMYRFLTLEQDLVIKYLFLNFILFTLIYNLIRWKKDSFPFLQFNVFITLRGFGWKQEIISEEWVLRGFRNGRIIYWYNTNFCQNFEFVFCDIGFDENEFLKLYKEYKQENSIMKENILKKFKTIIQVLK